MKHIDDIDTIVAGLLRQSYAGGQVQSVSAYSFHSLPVALLMPLVTETVVYVGYLRTDLGGDVSIFVRGVELVLNSVLCNTLVFFDDIAFAGVSLQFSGWRVLLDSTLVVSGGTDTFFMLDEDGNFILDELGNFILWQ